MTALDIVYGRQGGRRLQPQTDREQFVSLQLAIADGRVVRAECLCSYWWLAACDVGKPCDHCGEPMASVSA